eukprot:Rmarinus@m.11502
MPIPCFGIIWFLSWFTLTVGVTISNHGWAMYFDGFSSAGVISDFPLPENDFTISLWAKLRDPLPGQNILTYGSTTNANALALGMYSGCGTESGSFPEFLDTGWHHYAVNINYSGEDRVICTFYKDGSSLFSFSGSSTGIVPGGSLVVGQEQDDVGGGFASYQAFSGLIDDIRMYNSALSPDELSNDMTTLQSKELIFHFTFDNLYDVWTSEHTGDLEWGSSNIIPSVVGSLKMSLYGLERSWLSRQYEGIYFAKYVVRNTFDPSMMKTTLGPIPILSNISSDELQGNFNPSNVVVVRMSPSEEIVFSNYSVDGEESPWIRDAGDLTPGDGIMTYTAPSSFDDACSANEAVDNTFSFSYNEPCAAFTLVNDDEAVQVFIIAEHSPVGFSAATSEAGETSSYDGKYSLPEDADVLLVLSGLDQDGEGAQYTITQLPSNGTLHEVDTTALDTARIEQLELSNAYRKSYSHSSLDRSLCNELCLDEIETVPHVLTLSERLVVYSPSPTWSGEDQFCFSVDSPGASVSTDASCPNAVVLNVVQENDAPEVFNLTGHPQTDFNVSTNRFEYKFEILEDEEQTFTIYARDEDNNDLDEPNLLYVVITELPVLNQPVDHTLPDTCDSTFATDITSEVDSGMYNLWEAQCKDDPVEVVPMSSGGRYITRGQTGGIVSQWAQKVRNSSSHYSTSIESYPPDAVLGAFDFFPTYG